MVACFQITTLVLGLDAIVMADQNNQGGIVEKDLEVFRKVAAASGRR